MQYDTIFLHVNLLHIKIFETPIEENTRAIKIWQFTTGPRLFPVLKCLHEIFQTAKEVYYRAKPWPVLNFSVLYQALAFFIFVYSLENLNKIQGKI